MYVCIRLQSPLRSHGHAETGVLLPRRRQLTQQAEVEVFRRSSDETQTPFSSPTSDFNESPYQNPLYISPRYIYLFVHLLINTSMESLLYLIYQWNHYYI